MLAAFRTRSATGKVYNSHKRLRCFLETARENLESVVYCVTHRPDSRRFNSPFTHFCAINCTRCSSTSVRCRLVSGTMAGISLGG